MDVIINSISKGSSKGSNLFHKEVNNPVKIGEFTVSSIGFLVIEISESFKVSFSLSDGFVRIVRELPSISFDNKSNFEVNSEFFEVSFSFFGIIMELDNFSGSFDLIFSNVKGSLDFVFFKSGSSFFKTFLESVKHGRNSL